MPNMKMVLVAIVAVMISATASAKVTVTSRTDSNNQEHTRIDDGKKTTNCVTHVDSNKVKHTVCDR